MDHADARELIELAALEADGLDRLMSGDTAESAALAGHLVECRACAGELEAMRRTAEALRVVAEETPSPELRERTLAFVAAVGRPRAGMAGLAADTPAPVAGGAGAPAARWSSAALARTVAGLRRAVSGLRPATQLASQAPVAPRRLALGALAVAAVFAVVAAGSFVAADLQGQADRAHQEAANLHRLYGEVEALLEQPTTRLVALRTTSGVSAGTLIVDPASNRLAVLTDKLPAPEAGTEYRCWVEVDGIRRQVGRMWFEGGLAYWTGTGAGVAAWPSGAGFGISLEPVGEPGSAPAVLYGEL